MPTPTTKDAAAEKERLRQKMRNWRRKNKAHVSEYRKRRYRKIKKRIAAQIAAWRNRNRAAAQLIDRRARIKRAYGLTLEQWDALFDAQGRRCANPGCLVSERDNHKGWHVDHCHNTRVVRGILCHTCNTGLGLLGDSVERLQGALDYLRRFECQPSTVATFSPSRMAPTTLQS